MSYFEGQDGGWSQQQHRRQQSWDPSQTSLRAGPSPAPQYEDGQGHGAFSSQFEEVTRAQDNLAKSGKMYGSHGRRESAPIMGSFQRQLPDFDQRYGGSSRHHSVSEHEGPRGHASHGSSLQGYLSNQRFGGPRPSEAEQVMQAKRRAAAQRERELRNYHQEQQFNRNLSGAKSDRSMSPSAMNEDDRRELIARQHRALYGNESNLYTGDGSSPRPMSQDARVMAGSGSATGSSPMPYDGYGPPPTSGAEAGLSNQASAGGSGRSRANSASPQSANPGQFAMYEQQSSNNQTSNSSPGTASPTRGGVKGQLGGVAPIGTRPVGGHPNKRNTPPNPSPLGYGFEKPSQHPNERSQSSASNPAGSASDKGVGLGWNGNGGPWGSKAQASVWG